MATRGAYSVQIEMNGKPLEEKPHGDQIVLNGAQSGAGFYIVLESADPQARVFALITHNGEPTLRLGDGLNSLYPSYLVTKGEPLEVIRSIAGCCGKNSLLKFARRSDCTQRVLDTLGAIAVFHQAIEMAEDALLDKGGLPKQPAESVVDQFGVPHMDGSIHVAFHRLLVGKPQQVELLFHYWEQENALAMNKLFNRMLQDKAVEASLSNALPAACVRLKDNFRILEGHVLAPLPLDPTSLATFDFRYALPPPKRHSKRWHESVKSAPPGAQLLPPEPSQKRPRGPTPFWQPPLRYGRSSWDNPFVTM